MEVTFGIKVTGGSQPSVAKAAGEASLEITLTWCPKSTSAEKPDSIQVAELEQPAAAEDPGTGLLMTSPGPPAGRWIAAIHASEHDHSPLGSAVVIDTKRILT